MAKVKVLIVDDEIDYLGLIQERVAFWGYEVFLAQDGKTALAAVKEKKPDIVILDYFMPGMDGIAVLKKIRSFDAKIPVVMFTAHPEIKNIKGAEALGASAFVPKISSYSTDIESPLRSILAMVSKKISKDKD